MDSPLYDSTVGQAQQGCLPVDVRDNANLIKRSIYSQKNEKLALRAPVMLESTKDNFSFFWE